MNTEKYQQKRKKTGAPLLVAAILTLAVVGGMFLIHYSSQRNSYPLLRQLATLSADRSISAEEYDFFAKLVEKQGLDTDEKSVKRYIAAVNAEFYLGSQMKVCEPFDYAVFQYRTQSENQDRAMKKVTGQLYYGPDSFTEESYFEYLHSRLRSDMLTWLVEHRDHDMIEGARNFFKSNEKRFAAIKKVTYELTQNGVTEEKVMEDTMFKTMGQSDPTLMDALEKCEIGEERTLQDGTGRSIKKLDVVTEITPFEEQEQYVVELWLNHEVLDKLIDAVAENSKLVF